MDWCAAAAAPRAAHPACLCPAPPNRPAWRALTPGRPPACPAVWTSGIVQTIIYLDFFYYYVKSWRNNEKLALPP